MAVNYVTIKGYVRDGKLEVELPKDVVEGEVELRIPVDRETSPAQEMEPLWSDEELAELMKPEPLTGAEIVAAGLTGGWEHKGIEDSVEWIKDLRRKRRENRGW